MASQAPKIEEPAALRRPAPRASDLANLLRGRLLGLLGLLRRLVVVLLRLRRLLGSCGGVGRGGGGSSGRSRSGSGVARHRRRGHGEECDGGERADESLHDWRLLQEDTCEVEQPDQTARELENE